MCEVNPFSYLLFLEDTLAPKEPFLARVLKGKTIAEAAKELQISDTLLLKRVCELKKMGKIKDFEIV